MRSVHYRPNLIFKNFACLQMFNMGRIFNDKSAAVIEAEL